MSFLPLPPTSHLLEINIEFICGKVTIDKAVNGWEKPGEALWVSLLTFPCGDKRSLPCSWLCVRSFLGTVATGSSPSAPHKVPAHPRLPSGVQFGVFIAFSPPQPVMGSSLKPVLELECPALKAKFLPKPGVSQVSKPLLRTLLASGPSPGPPSAPAVLPCSVTEASQHLHLFQRHLRSFSLPSTR